MCLHRKKAKNPRSFPKVQHETKADVALNKKNQAQQKCTISSAVRVRIRFRQEHTELVVPFLELFECIRPFTDNLIPLTIKTYNAVARSPLVDQISRRITSELYED